VRCCILTLATVEALVVPAYTARPIDAECRRLSINRAEQFRQRNPEGPCNLLNVDQRDIPFAAFDPPMYVRSRPYISADSSCGTMGTGREQQAPNTVENHSARRKEELDASTT